MLTTNKIIERLAAEVTLSPEPPADLLAQALEQLVMEIQTGEEPERPLDWAKIISDSVACRHGAC